MKKIKTQTGRSMVEMLGVLAIIGVLSVGGIAGYNMAMEKHRLNQAIEAVNLIVQETRSAFAKQENYSGLGNSISKDFMGMTPGGNSLAAQILEKVSSYHPIWLYEYGNFKEFHIAVLNLSQSNCIKIHMVDWDKYGDDFIGVIAQDGNTYEDISFSLAESICNKSMEVRDIYTFSMRFLKN